jgi:glucose dehydrogenase
LCFAFAQTHFPLGQVSYFRTEQPAAYSPDTQLFYVPTNHVCMDYEPYKVSYTAGQAYVGAAVAMYPPKGDINMGNFIAWDGKTGKIAVVQQRARRDD